jgi:hypothetical protein
LQPVDDAVDALPHQALAEVDHEAQPEIAEPQVGEDLRLEQAIVGDRRLAFDDDTLVDEQVETKSSPGPPSVRCTSIADSTTIVTISFSVIPSAPSCVSASPRLCVKIRIWTRRQAGSARTRLPQSPSGATPTGPTSPSPTRSLSLRPVTFARRLHKYVAS